MRERGVQPAMERFWDRRAREDAFHYVDNREPLGTPDVEAFWRGGEQVVDWMLDELGVALRGDERVVEIGCGIGRLTRVLAARARSVDAIDVSREMLARAQHYNPGLDNVDWIHGDGITLRPLADGAFDACVSFVVFQHIPDPEITIGYIREIGRVLRDGGWAAFQISNQDPRVHKPPTAIRRVAATVRALSRRGPRGQAAPYWLGSALTLAQLEQAAREGGLELERVRNAGSQFCIVLARRMR